MTSDKHEAEIITVRCNLRWLIEKVATDSILMNTAVEMGLLSLLDTLAARASTIDDPEASEVLRLLCLSESRQA